MRYRIKAMLFNAVMGAQGKDDIRYYLNGFFVSADQSELVATDGHLMAIAPLEMVEDASPDETIPHGKFSGDGWIFRRITKPMLKSADYVVIDTKAQRLEIYGEKYTGKKYTGPKYIALELIDGSYPEYRGVKASNNSTAEVSASIGVEPWLIWRCFQWAGVRSLAMPVEFRIPADKMKAIELRPTGLLADLHITVMPCKIKEHNT